MPTMLIHPPLVENRMTKEEAFEIVDGLPTMKSIQVVDLAEAYLEYTEEEILDMLAHASDASDYTGQMVGLAKTMSADLRRSEIRDIRNHVIGTKLGVK